MSLTRLTSFVINQENLPDFGTAVLQHLDFKTLVKCRQVNREWRDLIDTFLWDRLLASQIGQKMKKEGSLPSNLDIIQLIRGADSEESRMGVARIYLRHAEMRNPEDDEGRSPLHLAACYGETGLFKLFSDTLSNKNPAGTVGHFKGVTPLHKAAEEGKVEICKIIMDSLDNKNPPATQGPHEGTTPLHWAAQQGKSEVCKIIMDTLDNKNPPATEGPHEGITPLHYAAQEGKVEVCKIIMDTLANKNPPATEGPHEGITPLHLAAQEGKVEVCKIILDNLEDKRPTTDLDSD